MSRPRPSERATRLLETLRVSDAFIGDLHEEFQRRQSSTWYWRQAFQAIAILGVDRVWKECVPTLWTLAAGWSVLCGWAVVWPLMASGLSNDPEGAGGPGWLIYTQYSTVVGGTDNGALSVSHPWTLLTMLGVVALSVIAAERVAGDRRVGLRVYGYSLAVYVVVVGGVIVRSSGFGEVLPYVVSHGMALIVARVAAQGRRTMNEDREKRVGRPLVFATGTAGGLGVGALALGLALAGGQVVIRDSNDEARAAGGQEEARPIDVPGPGGEASGPRPISVSPDGSWIAYIENGQIRFEPVGDRVSSTSAGPRVPPVPDDNEREAVPGEDGEGVRPVWSPDGRLIYYRDGDLWIRDLDGPSAAEPDR